MLEFYDSITLLAARFFSGSIPLPTRFIMARAVFYSFLAGFIFAFVFGFLAKRFFKRFKKSVKEHRRERRQAGAVKVPGGKFVGEITQYLNRVGVAVILVKRKKLKVGDTILIKGKQSEVVQKIGSLQINRKNVQQVKKGKEAGILVDQEVKTGDLVFRLKR